MHNSESVQENEMHNVLRYFELQADHPISARRPDFVTVNNNKKKKKKRKRTCRVVDFAVLVDHRVKLIEIKKRNKKQDFIIVYKKENLQNRRLSCPGGPLNKSEGR